MVKKKLLTIVFVLIAISCAAPPRQQPSVESVPPDESYSETKDIAPSDFPDTETMDGQSAALFDPSAVTSELYYETKENIVNFINQLNVIIKSQNYNEWLGYLDDDYYDYISSREYLQRISASAILQTKGVVLSDTHDYFINVVVPSRSNSRVDDIEFISGNRVRAITLNKGRRLLLYDLEKTQNGWKIVTSNYKNS
jgi:hypothetical protein